MDYLWQQLGGVVYQVTSIGWVPKAQSRVCHWRVFEIYSWFCYHILVLLCFSLQFVPTMFFFCLVLQSLSGSFCLTWSCSSPGQGFISHGDFLILMRVNSVRTLCGNYGIKSTWFWKLNQYFGAHKLNESIMHSYLSLWESDGSHKCMVSTIIINHIIMKVIYITMILCSFIRQQQTLQHRNSNMYTKSILLGQQCLDEKTLAEIYGLLWV